MPAKSQAPGIWSPLQGAPCLGPALETIRVPLPSVSPEACHSPGCIRLMPTIHGAGREREGMAASGGPLWCEGRSPCWGEETPVGGLKVLPAILGGGERRSPRTPLRPTCFN